jgi:hypothetical protein
MFGFRLDYLLFDVIEKTTEMTHEGLILFETTQIRLAVMGLSAQLPDRDLCVSHRDVVAAWVMIDEKPAKPESESLYVKESGRDQ